MNDTVKKSPAQAGAADTPVTAGVINPVGVMAIDVDAAMASGMGWKISQFVMSETRTGWDGLTDQERQEAEQYKEDLLEAHARYQRVIAQLEGRLQEVEAKNQEIDSRAVVVDGKKAYWDPVSKKFVFIDEKGGHSDLTEKQQEDARRQAEEMRQKGIKVAQADEKDKVLSDAEKLRRAIKETRQKDQNLTSSPSSGVSMSEDGRRKKDESITVEQNAKQILDATKIQVSAPIVREAEKAYDNKADIGDALSDLGVSDPPTKTASIDRNTTVARQVDGGSDLSSKPAFTLASNGVTPIPAKEVTGPVIQKNVAPSAVAV